MNRIKTLFEQRKGEKLLSVYYTAGYPKCDDTLEIAKRLANAGADFLEIGFPYSDPVADGPTIQHSSEQALQNGMSLKLLFEQLEDLRRYTDIPVLLMGYVNPLLQFGVERFCQCCAAVGIDGLIVPDLPLYEYHALYKDMFAHYGLSNIFLITPQTSDERIKQIDALTTGFIYMVSSAATTGNQLEVSAATESYFARVKGLELDNPLVIGFGIRNKSQFDSALEYADAAIIGSEFVKLLGTEGYLDRIPSFVAHIKGLSITA